jgi:purine-nucleoside phosphorylase
VANLPETAPNTASAERAAEILGRHDVAIVLGSGWAGAADALGAADATWDIPSLPGFVAPAVTGHGGTIRSVPFGDEARALVFLGRTHFYEGHGAAAAVHASRVSAATSCQLVILTNAAGAVNAGYTVGQPVLISDHLNLTGASPLVGAHFVDLTDCWSPRLRAIAKAVDPSLVEGVYAGLAGPHFETPAEIRMLRTLGADLVGMSTVLEAIAARAAGVEVLGLSLVTNMAAGVTNAPLDHHEVLATGVESAARLGTLLAAFLGAL